MQADMKGLDGRRMLTGGVRGINPKPRASARLAGDVAAAPIDLYQNRLMGSTISPLS